MRPGDTALVTGATRGIGRAIARELAARGVEVTGIYRADHAAAVALQRKCGARMICADLAADDGPAAVIGKVAEGGKPFAGVVFNAGIAVRAEFVSEREEEVDPLVAQLRGDLEAPLRLCRALLRAGMIADGAAIVFVTSNLARRGLVGKVAYSAAKAGLEGAVRGLARELGPRQIRVNAVAPGLLQTDMTRAVGEEGFEAYAREVPLGRAGTPEDVAPVAVFLLSEAAQYVSGQVIDVDGGWGA